MFMLYLLCWVSAQRAACRGYGTIPTAGRVALAFGEALLAVREGLVPVVGDGPGEGWVMAAPRAVWTPAGGWWPWRPGG